MVGLAGIIFVFVPESSWWLVSKGKLEDARKVLTRCHVDHEEEEIREQIVSHSTYDGQGAYPNVAKDAMAATIAHERVVAEQNAELGALALFKGRNFIRFIIASWPKIVQQFVGLSVFNTYATYFCE